MPNAKISTLYELHPMAETKYDFLKICYDLPAMAFGKNACYNISNENIFECKILQFFFSNANEITVGIIFNKKNISC